MRVYVYDVIRLVLGLCSRVVFWGFFSTTGMGIFNHVFVVVCSFVFTMAAAVASRSILVAVTFYVHSFTALKANPTNITQITRRCALIIRNHGMSRYIARVAVKPSFSRFVRVRVFWGRCHVKEFSLCSFLYSGSVFYGGVLIMVIFHTTLADYKMILYTVSLNSFVQKMDHNGVSFSTISASSVNV